MKLIYSAILLCLSLNCLFAQGLSGIESSLTKQLNTAGYSFSSFENISLPSNNEDLKKRFQPGNTYVIIVYPSNYSGDNLKFQLKETMGNGKVLAQNEGIKIIFDLTTANQTKYYFLDVLTKTKNYEDIVSIWIGYKSKSNTGSNSKENKAEDYYIGKSTTPKVSHETLNAISESASKETQRLKDQEAEMLIEFKEVIKKQLDKMGVTVKEFKVVSLAENNSNIPLKLYSGNLYGIVAYQYGTTELNEIEMSLKMKKVKGYEIDKTQDKKDTYFNVAKSKSSGIVLDYRAKKNSTDLLLDIASKTNKPTDQAIIAFVYQSLENKTANPDKNKAEDYYENTKTGKDILQKTIKNN